MRHRTRPAHGRTLAVAGGAATLVLLAATGAHAEGRGDVRVTKTVVNGGRNVIIGTSKTIRFPVAVTVKDDSGARKITDLSTFNRSNGYGFTTWDGDSSCARKSSTTSVCTGTMTVDPGWIADSDDIDSNRVAGVWQVNATVKANDGDYWISDNIARYKVKRASTLTTVIKPEKVAKGTKITVMRPSGPCRLGDPQVPRVHRAVGPAPVQEERRRPLHHRQDGEDGQRREDRHQGHRHGGGQLALVLPRHDDDREGHVGRGRGHPQVTSVA